MSLTSIETAARAERFPRASGDEPGVKFAQLPRT